MPAEGAVADAPATTAASDGAGTYHPHSCRVAIFAQYDHYNVLFLCTGVHGRLRPLNLGRRV